MSTFAIMSNSNQEKNKHRESVESNNEPEFEGEAPSLTTDAKTTAPDSTPAPTNKKRKTKTKKTKTKRKTKSKSKKTKIKSKTNPNEISKSNPNVRSSMNTGTGKASPNNGSKHNSTSVSATNSSTRSRESVDSTASDDYGSGLTTADQVQPKTNTITKSNSEPNKNSNQNNNAKMNGISITSPTPPDVANNPKSKKPASKTSTDVNPYDFITQTDASGRPMTLKQRESTGSGSGSELSDTQGADNEIPPPVPEDQPPPDSCLACLVRYLCCLNPNELYYDNYTPLLAMPAPHRVGKKCLVLDLDETLVHSSFIQIPEADFSIKITLEGRLFEIYVVKRPGVDEFLKEVGQHFEVVLFTASVPTYALKVMEELDKDGLVDAQLYREHCTLYEGNFVKDLNRLGRNLKQCIIVDNSPLSYQFQPENAIGVTTFMTDKSDRELYYCKEFLMSLKDADDVRTKLKHYNSFISEKIRQDFANIDPSKIPVAAVVPKQANNNSQGQTLQQSL